MKTSCRTTAVFALLALSTALVAGEFPSAAEGIPVPFDADGVAIPMPDAAGSENQGAFVTTASGMKVRMVEAAATEKVAETEKGDSKFKAIVEAMSPEEPVPALENDRFSLYLSDAVAFAQYERTAEPFDLEHGRIHIASLYSEERDTVLHTGIALDTSLTESLRLSFGTRAYVALLSLENMDALAAAIGAEAAYRLPFKALPLEFGASLYYAPDVLTFGAGDRVVDTQIDVSLPFRKQSSLFAGVRYLQVDTRPADREIDNRVHLGIRWDFL